MYKKTLDFIKENNLIGPKDKVVVGLSGGADSVCLLILLDKMKKELHIELEAVHVHHGLRGSEADRDASFSRELSERLGVPFVCVSVDVAGFSESRGISLEEAGRFLRYEALEEERIRWGGTKIAAAHHGDDQAETILYHLFRGTGLKGLGGMQSKRDLIVRPLLWASRKDILAYLEENGESYCEDSTNHETDYRRNRLRLEILPLIQERINGKASENILRAGAMAAEADRYFEKKATELLEQFSASRKDPPGRGMPADVLLGEEFIVRTYVIRRMIEELAGSKKDITHIHIELAEALLKKPAGRRADLPYALQAVRTYGELWIESAFTEDSAEKKGGIRLPSLEMTTFPYKKGQKIPKNGYTKWFDYDRINHMLSVRYRQAGDYFTLPGGGRKTVKAFFIDEKIPRQDREIIPLVADGPHILWIIGYRISEYYKITDETKTILQIQRNGGKENG